MSLSSYGGNSRVSFWEGKGRRRESSLHVATELPTCDANGQVLTSIRPIYEFPHFACAAGKIRVVVTGTWNCVDPFHSTCIHQWMKITCTALGCGQEFSTNDHCLGRTFGSFRSAGSAALVARVDLILIVGVNSTNF